MKRVIFLVRKHVSSNISFYIVEILLCAFLVIGGIVWAFDVFRDGFWAQGIVFLLNSFVGGYFLVRFSLRRKLVFFYVALALMGITIFANVGSLPEYERVLLNWQS